MMLNVIRGVVLVAVFLCAPVGYGSQVQSAESVTLRLEWRLSGYHLPFYWAKEKGYYSAEKLDVDIKEGAGSDQTINLIAGRQDDIGLADYMLMTAAAAKGMRLKGIFAVVPNGAWAVVSHEDKPIRTPADLIGKSIASTAGHKSIFDLLLAVNKIPTDQVRVQVTNAATRNTVFVNGQVDGFVSVVIGSPLDLVVRAQQGKGKPITFMPFEEFGVAPMGQGLIVHERTLTDRRDMLQRFIRATARGFAETMKKENLDEAVDIAMRHSKASEERRESVRLQWVETFPRLQTVNSKHMPIGWTADKDVEATIDILVNTGRMEKRVPINELFTNDFVPTKP
jgi:NitT/TauT family transport system substrate-binding protein